MGLEGVFWGQFNYHLSGIFKQTTQPSSQIPNLYILQTVSDWLKSPLSFLKDVVERKEHLSLPYLANRILSSPARPQSNRKQLPIFCP